MTSSVRNGSCTQLPDSRVEGMAEMKELRCAVIGLGRLGWKHAQHVRTAIPRAQLVAVSDANEQTLERFAAIAPEVKTYCDYQMILEDRDIDAVVIASSTSVHAMMARDAIEAGKAIFCEKPLSMELSEALAIQTLLRQKPTFFQLGFMRRFDPAYVEAMKRIEAGEMGKVVSLRAVSRDPGCPPIEFAKTSGGLVMDLCVHDLDLCRWFTAGEATEVYARGAVVRYPELGEIGDIDHVDISLTFANGTVATVEGSRNAQYGYDVRTEIICSEGALFVGELENPSMRSYSPKGVGYATVPGFLERFDKAYGLELESFVNDVLEGRMPRVGVDDGIQAQRLVIAVNTSLATGKPVRLID